MSWVLTASGDCPAENEESLAAELADVLAGYGATASQLSGESVNGPVHEIPAPPEKASKKPD